MDHQLHSYEEEIDPWSSTTETSKFNSNFNSTQSSSYNQHHPYYYHYEEAEEEIDDEGEEESHQQQQYGSQVNGSQAYSSPIEKTQTELVQVDRFIIQDTEKDDDGDQISMKSLDDKSSIRGLFPKFNFSFYDEEEEREEEEKGDSMSTEGELWRCAKHWPCGKDRIISAVENKQIDVDSFDAKGNTALMNACIQGKESVVWFLLNNGANVNVQNEYGYSALMWACLYGRHCIVQLLLESGAIQQLTRQDGQTARGIASHIICGYPSIVRILDEFECIRSF